MLADCQQLPTLTGRRIRLRWLTDSDTAALFTIFSDPDVAQFWSQPAMTHASEAEQLLQSIREYFDSRTLLHWGIERLDTDGIIGTCTLAAIDQGNRRADVGYALNRRVWGNGFASDALTTLFRFAFEVLELHRIEADVDPRNGRSIRTLERQGFRHEGFLRERWFVDGKVQDTALYGLLRREWTAGEADNTASETPGRSCFQNESPR